MKVKGGGECRSQRISGALPDAREFWVSLSLKVLASMGTIFSTPSIKACPAEGPLSDGCTLSGRLASSPALSLNLTQSDLSSRLVSIAVKAKGRARPVRSDYNSIITSEKGVTWGKDL